jgi:SAM-dependent methyltransferase
MTRVPEETLRRLFALGDERWEQFRQRRDKTYHAFVPADYVPVTAVLSQLRSRADSFLELGSGVGVVAIVAALLGYDSAGIEIDPWLVGASEDLAVEFDAPVTFATGTFVPAEFQETVDRHESEIPTVADGLPAYSELGCDLDDFDLVYAFPWPGTEDVFFEMMAAHGRPGALFLTFGELEGCRIWRDGEEITL